MATTNITIRIDERLARQAKILAAEKGTSLSAMAAEWLRGKVARESDYEKARRQDLALMRRGWDMGTHGKATWTREELHER